MTLCNFRVALLRVYLRPMANKDGPTLSYTSLYKRAGDTAKAIERILEIDKIIRQLTQVYRTLRT